MASPNAAKYVLPPKLRWALAVLLLIASIGFFSHRLQTRADYKPADFAMYYTCSRIWLLGGDPYSRPASLQAWITAGGRPDIMPDDVRSVFGLEWMPILALPPGNVLLAPFALLPPAPATAAWYALTSLLMVAALAALIHLAGGRLQQPMGLLLTSVTLLLAPTQEMFGYAQPSGVTIFLCIIGLWAAPKNEWLAGGLIAAAASLKPQLGCLFLLYFLLVGRRRLILSAGLVGTLCLLISVIPMHLRGIDWLTGWRENMLLADQPGGMNDTASGASSRYYQLHLEMIVDPILHSQGWVSTITTLLMLNVMAITFAVRRQRTSQRDYLLEASFVSVVTILFLYHRFYDGMLMIVPFAWAMTNLRQRPWIASLLCGATLSFVVPVAVVRRLAQLLFHREPHEIHQLWWTLGVEPWRTWVLLIAALTIIAAIRRRQPETETRPQPLSIAHAM